jgi:hypothetical protein
MPVSRARRRSADFLTLMTDSDRWAEVSVSMYRVRAVAESIVHLRRTPVTEGESAVRQRALEEEVHGLVVVGEPEATVSQPN